MSSSSSSIPEQQSRVIVAARALIMMFVLVGVPVCAFFYAPVRSLIDPLIAMLQEEESSSTDDPFSESTFEGDWAQPPLEIDSMPPGGVSATGEDDRSPFTAAGQAPPWSQEMAVHPPLAHPMGMPGATPRPQVSEGMNSSTQPDLPWLTESQAGTMPPYNTDPGTGSEAPPIPNWGGETATQNPVAQIPNPGQIVNSRGMGGLPTAVAPMPTGPLPTTPQPVLPTSEQIAYFQTRFSELHAVNCLLEYSWFLADGRILYHFTCDAASPDGTDPSQFVATDSTSVRAMESVLFQVENWQVANANRLEDAGQRIGRAPNAGQSQGYPWQ